MAFSSLTFLFIFLPLFLACYFVLPFRWWKNGVLLVASLIFYAWAEPVYVFWLIGITLLNWAIALLVSQLMRRGQSAAAKWVATAAVIGNLLVLLSFKYAGFIAESLNSGFGLALPIPASSFPLGLSFFTFSIISFQIDVYQESTTAPRNPLIMLLHVAMFPKLLQGPITRYGQLEAELAARKPNLEDMAAGARRFIIGLAKKVILADTLAKAANKIFALWMPTLGMDLAWLGIFTYSLQIYFDFSGYTDMAIGLGRILGFHLPENFNYPYISRSISDFWRRWHMTLTAWFRIYIFLPLEFARKRQKFLRQQTNLIIVFLLTGLWHGASWNYVLWGGYFGLLLALESGSWGKRLKKLPPFLQHSYTILLLLVGWVFFRLENTSQWGSFFSALLGGHGISGPSNMRSLNIVWVIPVIFLALLGSTPWVKIISQKLGTRSWAPIAGNFATLVLFLLSIAFVLSGGYQSFLYFQF